MAERLIETSYQPARPAEALGTSAWTAGVGVSPLPGYYVRGD
jgi:hypothetical protein